MSNVLQEFEADLSVAELLTALQHDCVTFFGFYLGEDLTLQVPDFHEEIWAELLDMLRQSNLPGATFQLHKLFAVPREHSKSTIAKLAVILFLRYSPLSFVLYVSKTNGMATNAIRDILMWLNSAQEQQLFGPVSVIKSSENESLWIINIMIRRSSTERPWVKTCIFRALGSDQQVRGTLIRNKRPQIVVIDDIEDLDNTKVSQQGGLDEWFMGSLMKAFDSTRHVCIFIGNMIRKTSLLARLAKEKEWNPTVFGCLVRDRVTNELRPLWIGKHTVEALLKEYRYYKRMGTGHMWEAEMMNLTQDEILTNDLSKVVMPPMPMPEDLEAGCLCLDPAFGLKGWNDYSAITVHARIKGVGIPVIIDSWYGRVKEDVIFDMLLELSMKWGISTWCIESVAAQQLLIPYFTLLMQVRKLNENVITFLPLQSGKQAKPSRILAMTNAVGTSNYGIAEGQNELLQAYVDYSSDSTEHDDLVDSGAYGLIAWQTYGQTIESNGIKQIAMVIFNSGEENTLMLEHQIAGF